MKDILVVLNGGDTEKAVEEAFRVAQSDSRKVKILQILDSGLYFYGHNDLVAPRLSKRTYLLYIREQVLEQGALEAEALRERARNIGVSLEIEPVETDDVIATVIAESKKGYEQIFLAKEKRKLLPLIKRHLAKQLRKSVSARVVEC
jgi:phosphoglycerate-specific signal transduction histidine kinase